MAETCKRCGRDVFEPGYGVSPWEGECTKDDPRACRASAISYRRGIAEGVKLAKEYAFASVGYQHGEPSAHIEWHEVDAEVSAAKGS
jgi:hypothetical protein